MTSFKFDRRLYTPEAVRAAAAAWHDVADIGVRDEKDCVVAECREDVRALDEEYGGDFEGEFRNQALWETKR